MLLLFCRRSSVVVAFDAFGFWLSLSSSVSFGFVCCGCRCFTLHWTWSLGVVSCLFVFLENKEKGTERWKAGGDRWEVKRKRREPFHN